MTPLIRKTRNTRRTLATALLAAAVAIASTVALAAPTVSTLGGDTRVRLASEFTGALGTLGVAASPSFPARISNGTASFPIPSGEIDLGTLKGEINHTGGLNLAAGGLTVNISSFVIDTTGASPVLTGLVKANDNVVARITLFDLRLTRGPVVKPGRNLSKLTVDNVAVTLSAEAAATLNDVFDVTAFRAGLPIGTARVDTGFFDPDSK